MLFLRKWYTQTCCPRDFAGIELLHANALYARPHDDSLLLSVDGNDRVTVFIASSVSTHRFGISHVIAVRLTPGTHLICTFMVYPASKRPVVEYYTGSTNVTMLQGRHRAPHSLCFPHSE